MCQCHWFDVFVEQCPLKYTHNRVNFWAACSGKTASSVATVRCGKVHHLAQGVLTNVNVLISEPSYWWSSRTVPRIKLLIASSPKKIRLQLSTLACFRLRLQRSSTSPKTAKLLQFAMLLVFWDAETTANSDLFEQQGAQNTATYSDFWHNVNKQRCLHQHDGQKHWYSRCVWHFLHQAVKPA